MNHQFTPGPWHLGYNKHDASIHNDVTIASVCDDATHWKANARLIAAAPELLAIVRALLPHANNEWTRLDDLAHRGNRESEDSAMELDRLIEHARETIEEITGDNE